MLMAWSEQPQLVERFRAVCSFLKQTCKHWKLGSSYQGWVAAQMREMPRLIPLIVRQLRQHMRRLQTRHPDCRWETFAIDGSQITCPRTLENQRAMGDLGKPDGKPLLSVTSILHLPTGMPWDFRVGPGTDSERAHLRDMLDQLPEGSLLVADAGFVGYELCCELIRRKQHFLLRVGGNIHLLNSLGYDVEVEGRTVYLWPAKQQNRNSPPIRLRLIVVQDEKKRPVYLVTSVLDPAELTDQEAGEIFRQRWGIEVFYRTAKQTMQHHVMRSRTPDTCYLEISWALLGVWVLELMTARQLDAAGADPRRASPAQARNAVRRAMRNQRPCDRTRRWLLRVLADCRLDDYERHHPKASRNYPRKKNHQPPGPPIIKPPNETQLRKAKQLTPIFIRA